MSECVILVGRKNPVAGRAEVSKVVASRRNNIKGKGHNRRQRLDIWDGSERGWIQGGGGGTQPGSIGLSTQYTSRPADQQDVCWLVLGMSVSTSSCTCTCTYSKTVCHSPVGGLAG